MQQNDRADPCSARLGLALLELGLARASQLLLGSARLSPARASSTRLGLARLGFGRVWLCSAWLGGTPPLQPKFVRPPAENMG